MIHFGDGSFALFMSGYETREPGLGCVARASAPRLPASAAHRARAAPPGSRNRGMPFWPLHPETARNQLRFDPSPQPRLGVMHWPAFGFGDGKTYCASQREKWIP